MMIIIMNIFILARFVPRETDNNILQFIFVLNREIGSELLTLTKRWIKKKSVILDIQKQANCFHEYHISISTSTHDNLEFYTNSKHMIYLYVTICFNSSIDNDGRRTTNMNWFSHIVDVIYARISDLMKLY